MPKLTKEQQADKQKAIEYLRKILPEGSTVYTKVEHVARSGMSRRISLYIPATDGIDNITYYVARALGHTRNPRDGGITVSGCGMDMCFATVYNLGRALFPDGGSLENSPRKYQELKHGKTREIDGGYLLKKCDL